MEKYITIRRNYLSVTTYAITVDLGNPVIEIMYNVVTSSQQGLGTSLLDCKYLSTDLTRKNTGSMKQLEQIKRQKYNRRMDGNFETSSFLKVG